MSGEGVELVEEVSRCFSRSMLLVVVVWVVLEASWEGFVSDRGMVVMLDIVFTVHSILAQGRG